GALRVRATAFPAQREGTRPMEEMSGRSIFYRDADAGQIAAGMRERVSARPEPREAMRHFKVLQSACRAQNLIDLQLGPEEPPHREAVDAPGAKTTREPAAFEPATPQRHPPSH